MVSQATRSVVDYITKDPYSRVTVIEPVLYEFVATGPGANQRWRRTLPSNRAVRLGRAPRQGWAVPWDLRVSREHADLMLNHDRLTVRRLNAARNQIYLRGEPREEFSIAAGEDFRIGRRGSSERRCGSAGRRIVSDAG